MQREHQNTHDRRKDRREHRAENTESHRKNKNIVKNRIKDTARNHAEHRKFGTSVVLDKSRKNRIRDKRRGKEQHHAEINLCHLIGLRLRAEKHGQRIHKEKTEQRKTESGQYTGNCSCRIDPSGAFGVSDRAGYNEARRAADADHQADAVDKIINRYSQVERGKAVGAKSLGDKIGVCQNINRLSYHGEHTRQNILQKFPFATHTSPSLLMFFIVILKEPAHKSQEAEPPKEFRLLLPFTVLTPA